MHLPHNPSHTHRLAYTRQSPFLRINTTSYQFICRTIYTHFHEIGLVEWVRNSTKMSDCFKAVSNPRVQDVHCNYDSYVFTHSEFHWLNRRGLQRHKNTYSCFKMNKNVARFMMLVGVETVCEKGYIRWTKVNNHNYIQRKLDELLQNQILECLFNAILQSLRIIIIWGLFSENKQLNHHHMIN